MAKTYKTFNWNDFICIQDPVHQMYLDTENYFNVYGPLLETFDGADADSFIDLFFESSPVHCSILLFKDEESRLDFQYLAIQMKLIPPIQEICEGESKKQKNRRKHPKKPKRVLTIKHHHQLRSEQMLKTLDKLGRQLENEGDPNIRKRINDKIQRLTKELEKTR